VTFRISIVPGVTPGKWVRAWDERNPRDPVAVTLVEQDAQLEPLRSAEVDMAFVRLPVEREGLHAIPLYVEQPVALVPRDHPADGMADVQLADVADELLDVAGLSAKQSVEVVAGGAGVLVVPLSVARLHHRRDVVAVPVTDAETTQVALVWPVDSDDVRIEEFIGVVRGRTVRSSRGPQPAPAKQVTPPRRQSPDRGRRKRR
jgi:DNA-binding transcriptional LysR family regulator